MYKSAVYPYDSSFTPVLRHRTTLQNIEIVAVISPKGWGYCGKDASFADEGAKIGINVTDFTNIKWYDFDSLLLVNSDNELDFDKFILPKVIECAINKKTILLARDITEDEKNKISSVCSEYNTKFEDLSKMRVAFSDPLFSENLKDLNTPVVLVCGTSKNTSKFEIQLAIREELINRGYQVSQIGSRPYCEMLGFHSWPKFMQGKDYSENEKIILMNHFVKCIELKDNPEIILIGLPGGIFSTDKNSTDEFGMTAQELTQALLPDYCIISMAYNKYKEEYFDVLKTGVKGRYDVEIDLYNLSNIYMDIQEYKNTGKISYLKLPESIINREVRNFNNQSVINIHSSGTPKFAVDSIIDKLSQYGNMMTV
jgi:peptide maturation system protein (TIGR04066 family)